MPSMIITKANAKENLGEFICHSITKAHAKTNLQIFMCTILFKIITRMNLLFSNYLGDYRYSFQGSVEFICITVTFTFFLLQNSVTEKNSPREFLAITVT